MGYIPDMASCWQNGRRHQCRQHIHRSGTTTSHHSTTHVQYTVSWIAQMPDTRYQASALANMWTNLATGLSQQNSTTKAPRHTNTLETSDIGIHVLPDLQNGTESSVKTPSQPIFPPILSNDNDVPTRGSGSKHVEEVPSSAARNMLGAIDNNNHIIPSQKGDRSQSTEVDGSTNPASALRPQRDANKPNLPRDSEGPRSRDVVGKKRQYAHRGGTAGTTSRAQTIGAQPARHHGFSALSLDQHGTCGSENWGVARTHRSNAPSFDIHTTPEVDRMWKDGGDWRRKE